VTKKSNKTGQWLQRLLAFVVVTACGGLACFTNAARAGYAAILVDGDTGKSVNEVNPDEQIYPASLTKMMTLYIAFQNLQSGKLHMNQSLRVSTWAATKAPTKLGLRAGQSVTVQDCVLGMITKSANDAATVVAEGIGGSEPGFVGMMNAQARRLGMSNTYFHNASGLPDPAQVSSARDLSKLSMALYKDFPQYWHYFATTEFVFHGRIVRGHNHLMDRYPGMDGLKTGFTDASGFNLASTATRDGHRLFGVVLGSRTATDRDNLMARLLDDGFEHRQTPPELVAAVGRNNSVIHRVLNALSPIDTAEAADAPPAKPVAGKRYRRGTRLAAVAAHDSCPARKGGHGSTCLRRHAAPKSQASPKLAHAGKKPAARHQQVAKAGKPTPKPAKPHARVVKAAHA